MLYKLLLQETLSVHFEIFRAIEGELQDKKHFEQQLNEHFKKIFVKHLKKIQDTLRTLLEVIHWVFQLALLRSIKEHFK